MQTASGLSRDARTAWPLAGARNRQTAGIPAPICGSCASAQAPTSALAQMRSRALGPTAQGGYRAPRRAGHFQDRRSQALERAVPGFCVLDVTYTALSP